jgi:2-polyprenyl-3-methyl-5-hydroxy-6-metoxy-1,4-benzoquinol methylase
MTEYDDEALKTKTDEFLEFNQVLREYRFKEISRYLRSGEVLDVGCGHPYMIRELYQFSRMTNLRISGIDPDPERLHKAKHVSLQDVKFHLGTLERFEFPHKYHVIICSHVIEHSYDPFEFLQGAYRNLYDSGIVIITCPNALSLHKRVSEIAGLSEPYKLSATDLMQDHKHIFDRLKLETLVRAAGFEIEVSKGIMLKPFPNAMMADLISRRFADALYEIGKDPALTDYCSSLMIVARPR